MGAAEVLEHVEGVTLGCRSCGAQLRALDTERTVRCPYCASTTIVERPSAEVPPAEFVVGFSLARADAERFFRRFLRQRRWFAPSRIRDAALHEVRGVYVPAYLYSVEAESTFKAEIGEQYTVVVSTGKTMQSQTHTEWRSLRGRYSSYVSDLVVGASQAIGNEELERIEPFDLKRLRRYSPALLSGWFAEEATRPAEEVIVDAREEAMSSMDRKLAAFMPGDKHRDLVHWTTLVNESSSLVLVPVFVAVARYSEEAEPIRLLCNGQSGKVTGKVPLSWPKIIAAVLATAAAAAAGYLLLESTEAVHDVLRFLSGARR